MKKPVSFFGVIVLILFVSVSVGWAGQNKPTFSGSVTASSKYVFRGYEYSRDSLVFFLDGAVSYKGFSAGIWADMDTDHYRTEDMDNKGNMELYETDLSLSYSNSVDEFNYSVGWVYYDYEDYATGENQEVFASLGLDTLLSPTLNVYSEIEDGEAYYASLDLSHSTDLTDSLALDCGAKAGYEYDEDGASGGGTYSELHDGLLWAGLSMPLGDNWSLAPAVNYSFPLSGDSEEELENDKGDSRYFWGSLSLSTSF